MPDDLTLDDIVNKDIFELMGAADMPEEKKRELYTKILETIQNRVIVRIANQLSDQDVEEFKRAVAGGDQKKMTDFLNSKGLDLDKMMIEEAFLYKAELIELSKPLRQAAFKKG